MPRRYGNMAGERLAMRSALQLKKRTLRRTAHASLQSKSAHRKQELKLNTTAGYVYANSPPTGANDSIFTGVSASSVHAAMPPMPLLGDSVEEIRVLAS